MTTNGYPPTLRELAEIVGLQSHANIRYHVDHLVDSGLVTYDPHLSRSIRYVGPIQGGKPSNPREWTIIAPCGCRITMDSRVVERCGYSYCSIPEDEREAIHE